MEDLINSIPKSYIWKTAKGEELRQGFTLRWSESRQKWLCGYAGGTARFRQENLNKQFVEADDPVEAVAFFVDLISKQKERKW